jgi:hypothetical protein
VPRVKQASKSKRITKATATKTLGAAGLSFSLLGSVSASAVPTSDIPQSDDKSTDQRFVLGEEEMADVSLATFHLFDRENFGSGVQVARGCGGCGGCRGCGGGGGCGGFRGCRGGFVGGCRGCGGCGCGIGLGLGSLLIACAGCGGCCGSWGACRWCSPATHIARRATSHERTREKIPTLARARTKTAPKSTAPSMEASEDHKTEPPENPNTKQIETRSSQVELPNAPEVVVPDNKTDAPEVARAETSQSTPEQPHTDGVAPGSGQTEVATIEHVETSASISKSESAGDADSRSVQQQIAAAASMAERLSDPANQRPKPNATEGENQTKTDGDRTASIRSDATEALFALLVSQTEIRSVSDLAGKSVAIDKGLPAENSVRTALVAAGATTVELSTGDSKAVDRLVGGEVPAAVIALVSSNAAEAFPDIPGYKVFRVPLSPLSMKDGHTTP